MWWGLWRRICMMKGTYHVFCTDCTVSMNSTSLIIEKTATLSVKNSPSTAKYSDLISRSDSSVCSKRCKWARALKPSARADPARKNTPGPETRVRLRLPRRTRPPHALEEPRQTHQAWTRLPRQNLRTSVTRELASNGLPYEYVPMSKCTCSKRRTTGVRERRITETNPQVRIVNTEQNHAYQQPWSWGAAGERTPAQPEALQDQEWGPQHALQALQEQERGPQHSLRLYRTRSEDPSTPCSSPGPGVEDPRSTPCGMHTKRLTV